MPELNLDGYTDLPPGKVAAIVTFLEMRRQPQLPSQGEVRLRFISHPRLDDYRALYRAIGEDWLWESRLRLSDERLSAILHLPANELFSAERNGVEIGIVELDRRKEDDVEITFFGLKPDAVGQGLGGVMMIEALRQAWQDETRRVWLHTCTLDHPRAVGFYQHCGFVPYRRAIDVFDDPRLKGHIAPDAAPQFPII